ncbi:MAG: hypothetical protein H7335_13155 [Massilia sp.]|nr:hypothetical protein [Massilia sp.]
MSLSACHAVVPAFLCRHGDLLLYLVPSAALALLIRLLAGSHPVFFLLTVAGTLCHELAHYGVALLTGARPTALSVIPRRIGRHWQLGSVTLTRVRWYNAAPAALAPMLILALPLLVASWRTGPDWRFQPLDLAFAFALAPQLLSFWPSAGDWRIALRSWPYLLIIVGTGIWMLPYYPMLFQFVRA